MLERFTAQARVVVIAARETCRARGDSMIGPIHVLLAATESGGPVADLLATRGLDAASIDAAMGTERLRAAPPESGKAEPGAPEQRERNGQGQTAPAFDHLDTEALRAFGIDLDAVRRAVESAFGVGALDRAEARSPVEGGGDGVGVRRRCRFGPGGHIPFTRGAKKSLELALREAIHARSTDIGVEHLVLGVLRADDDVVTAVLTRLNVNVPGLRADLTSGRRRSA